MNTLLSNLKVWYLPSLKYVRKAWLTLLFLLFSTACFAGTLAEIRSLKPGMWYEIENTALSNKAFNWSPGKLPGVFFDGIIKAWSGGAFDTKRNRLIIFGGGHTDYGGNEIYGFSFEDFSWRLLAKPSSRKDILAHIITPEEDKKSYYPDGLPVSRHTLNYLLYHPGWDALVSVGYRSGFRRSGDWGNNIDYYCFSDKKWYTDKKARFSDNAYTKCSTIDTGTGHLWTYTLRLSRNLWEYDPISDLWTQRTPERKVYGGWDEYMSMEIDPVRKRCVVLGFGKYLVYDISKYDTKGYVKLVAERSSGPQEPVNTAYPTLCYDPISGYMVSWLEGTSVYALDLDKHEWIKLQDSESNIVKPTAPAKAGTYGRWCYVPSLNIFAVVNSAHENVYVYKFYSDIRDTIPPIIKTFNMPNISHTKRIAVDIESEDNVGIVGWRITENPDMEKVWQKRKPEHIKVDKNGEYTLWLLARDLDGNIARSKSVTVLVEADDQKPSLEKFQIRYIETDLSIEIVNLVGMDNVGVEGYCISESNESPDPFNSKLWSSTPPKVYKASGCGKISLHAWVKDMEGNVSEPLKREISIRLPHSRNAILVGPNHPFKTIAEAVKKADHGAIIEVDAGEYIDDTVSVRKNDITIRGIGGFAHIKGTKKIKNKKGLIVQFGNNLTLENLEFSGARVRDKNGAGVRNDAGNLTIRYCYFHDNENGILVGQARESEILVENSCFDKNGFGKGQTHNIYVGLAKKFTIRHSLVQNAHIGHNIKSRAQTNVIEYCAILEPTGATSYSIDIPNGGDTYIIGNVIHQGAAAENRTYISYKQIKKLDWNKGRNLFFVNNTIYNTEDEGQPFILRSGPDAGEIVFLNNVIFDLHKNTKIWYNKGKRPRIKNTIILSKDPGFTNYKRYDFSLTSKASKLINKGIQYPRNEGYPLLPQFQYRSWEKQEKRPVAGALDIGAYEFSPISQNQ